MKLEYHGRIASIAVRHSNWMMPALTTLALIVALIGMTACGHH